MCVTFKDTSSGQSMLWSEGSRASPTPSPASGSGSLTSGTCGPSTHGSFEPSDPVGSLLRTSLVCALPPQMRSSVTWKKRDTPCGRAWWVLGRSVPRTSGTECGSWPTPRQADHARGPDYGATDNHDGGGNLLGAVKLWPTPASRDWKNDGNAPAAQARNSPCLPAAVVISGLAAPASPSTNGKLRDWSTPQAHDSQGMGNPQRVGRFGTMHGGRNLNDDAAKEAGSRGTLNPAWVTQLMGFPDGWLDLPAETLSKLSATASSPRSPKR